MGGSGRPARVHVLALGGTIAMRRDVDTRAAAPGLSAEDLLVAVPGLADVADVVPRTLRNMPGASLDVGAVRAVIHAAHEACDAGADGVVVTQGTDTLEETAYLVDLLWARPEPVVMTGAMRPADAVGADGPANLDAAVRVAAAPEARGRGCLVVMNDEAHAARSVRKMHTVSPSAFASPGTGPIGWVHEGGIRLLSASAAPRHEPVVVPDTASIATVGLVRAALGADDRMLRWAATTYDGLVVEAMGGGHLPQWWIPPLAAAADRVPVVVASRTGSGALLHRTYGFAGAEGDLFDAGALGAGDLDGLKARILLTVALMAGGDRATVAEIVQRHTANAYAPVRTQPLPEGAVR